MTDFLVREGHVAFAKPLPRALLRDRRLSWAARALFAFLWDLPLGWRPNARHLAQMGPDGRDAVRARLAELEAVGALRFEPIPAGEGGRLAGRRWVLRAAEMWAVEAPLATEPPPNGRFTDDRIFRFSENPIFGKSAPKVHREEGSAVLTPTTTPSAPPATVGGGGGPPPQWGEAAALEVEVAAASPTGVRNRAGLRKKILARYAIEGGPDAEVVAELARRRDAAERRAAEEAARPPVAPPASREVASRGLARAKAALGRGVAP